MALNIEEKIKEVIKYTAKDIQDYTQIIASLKETYQKHQEQSDAHSACQNCLLFQEVIQNQESILETLRERLLQARKGEIYE